MDMIKPDLSTLANKLKAAEGIATWETPRDLARISLDAISAQESLGRTQRSEGHLRLTGDGVDGHTASLEEVGILMTRWQKLVTAIGGSSLGFKGLRGRMSPLVSTQTKLLLNAGATPGSVMLEFTAAQAPAEELYPNGDVPMGDIAEEPLVDVAMKKSLLLLSSVVELGPDVEDGKFLEEVVELGPRAASALTEMAKAVSAGHFDLEVEWREPSQPTLRTRLRAGDARRIADIVTSRKLDSEPETLDGIIHTITDISSIHLQLDSGEMISIKPGKIGHEDLRPISHGDRVQIEVDVKTTQRIGEDPSPTYIAKSIRRATTYRR
ncbi:hypothetical protein [Paeniglutamicibacter sp. Y32M11]|uniref:hypothetical protein n=1 Tax=Paeniglutamicibacter sp. Y32M11 TaxID=2853258 RepID=UPI001C527BEC|nr:hypothetical protein [Paeniglutamicibacter sp. Y32M11]QXQ11487.1 hypothetical protein KUF55_06275 [Paeniglutamicibacter sp. Y32M11]